MPAVAGLSVVENGYPQIDSRLNWQIKFRLGVQFACCFQAPPTVFPRPHGCYVAAVADEWLINDHGRDNRTDRIAVQLIRIGHGFLQCHPPMAIVTMLRIESEVAKPILHGLQIFG